MLILQLLISVMLGAVLGWERERHGRSAGLRTHMLLCLGSTLFTIISVSFTRSGSDPTRIAAQIVSGIGFIGAGAILRQGSEVKGLTSATSLWTAAAIGMAVGVGGEFIGVAILATAIAFVTLSVINRLAERIARPMDVYEISLTLVQTANLPELFALIAGSGMNLLSFRHSPVESPGTMQLSLILRGEVGTPITTTVLQLGARADVVAARVEP